MFKLHEQRIENYPIHEHPRVLVLPSAISKTHPPFDYEVSPMLQVWKASDYGRDALAAAAELYGFGYDRQHYVPLRGSESVGLPLVRVLGWLADVVGLCRHNLHIEVQHFLRTRLAKNNVAIPLQNITANIRGTRNKLFPAKAFQFSCLQWNAQSSEQPHKVSLPDGYHIGNANLAAIGNPNLDLPEHH